MAIDTTDKALNLATRLVAQATNLMDAVRALDALREEKEGSGVDFAPGGTPMDFSGTGLKHIDGNNINNVLTTAGAVKSWMESTFNDDNLDAVRP
jgi:hypothetical protein